MRENFDTVASASGAPNYKVGFLQLKDGEKAVVRILVDSVDDLAAYTYHEITLPDQTKKKVGCIRSIRDDVAKCPMCAKGEKIGRVTYIHMLRYTPNPDGTMKVEPLRWGKTPSNNAKSIVGTIRNALEEYGPLSEYVSTISRTGSGLTDTTYSLKINVPEKVYGPASNYPLDRTLFDGETEDGTLIKNWTEDEMNTYLSTGQLPEYNSEQQAPQFNPATAQQAYQPVTAPQDAYKTDVPWTDGTAQQQPFNPQPQNMIGFNVPYGAQSTAGIDRPVRSY